MKELTKIINDNSYKILDEYYEKESIFDILNIPQKNHIDLKFLYWLLDDKESHKLGAFPLKCFIYACLAIKAVNISATDTKQKNIEEAKNYIFPEEWSTDLFFKNYEIKDLKINREYNLGKSGIVDLYLEFSIVSNEDSNIKFNRNVVIFIENKIKSSANNEQTKKYYDWFIYQDKCKNTLPIFVYLISDKQGFITPIEDNTMQMSYETLSHMVIEQCITNKNIDEETKTIICTHLKLQNNLDTDKKQ